jgi:para-aminobenzoate synthetase component 1
MSIDSTVSGPAARLVPAGWSGVPTAYLGGRLATDLIDVADLRERPDALEAGGWWAVLGTFEGRIRAYRFGHVRRMSLAEAMSSVAGDRPAAGWRGPDRSEWRSSAGHDEYIGGVAAIRERIAAGDVYQVNLCRMLSAPLPPTADPWALAVRLAYGNPSPYQGMLHTGDDWVVTASPELFLSRSGSEVHSSPMKGTTRSGEPFAAKDFPENIMITDLVRNDLGRVAMPGSVRVTRLAVREEHPGIAHLVSTVRARLVPGVGWESLLGATFPPGSVSGAPKYTALQVIGEWEPVPRGPYCGAVGFVDADHGEAVLAVGIRTFFTAADPDGGRTLNFGTGAGITHPSDPEAEWQETELKAARLIALASR